MPEKLVTAEQVREADGAYGGCPHLERWVRLQVDTVRWDRYRQQLETARAKAEEESDWAIRAIRMLTAIDTGALEGLYEIDRGFTYEVAFQSSALEAIEGREGEHVRSLVEAQLRGYERVLDFAT